jgi:spore germination cell wall hydrolase CwlJ-like protein
MILETILALTPADYSYLAKAVQVEAASKTADEFCVAVSILNRVRSPLYPNNVRDVVLSPGQYEGMKYNPFAKASVISRLRDTDSMLKAYETIGDRTDFKGQRMLRYRVASEDPMCHPKGNFYHYHWQS